jgi:hypothetical protein
MWFFLRGDGQPPSNCPLSRRVLGMVLQRKRCGGLGNDFASASAASIDARMVGFFSGLVLLVELRTVADFYVVAAPEERHGSPSSVRKPQPFHAKGGGALWPANGVGLEER